MTVSGRGRLARMSYHDTGNRPRRAGSARLRAVTPYRPGQRNISANYQTFKCSLTSARPAPACRWQTDKTQCLLVFDRSDVRPLPQTTHSGERRADLRTNRFGEFRVSPARSKAAASCIMPPLSPIPSWVQRVGCSE